MSDHSPFIGENPEFLLRLPVQEQIDLLYGYLGQDLIEALAPGVRTPGPFARTHTNSDWLKTMNTVGVNVRTIGSFFHILPYALTLPSAQRGLHILPFWEPGVVGSLYGPSSWNINPEFFNPALADVFPDLSDAALQLKAVVNILHRLGFAVGMDVVPHTDRFSEMVLANPSFFEWIQRRDLAIVRHDSDLHRDVAALIYDVFMRSGNAVGGPMPEGREAFFENWPEADRLLALFGAPNDTHGRLARRKAIIRALHEKGFETVPVTMAPPYRGLEVHPGPAARICDADGLEWRDYRMTAPQPMSRVFGPLTRYKLYESKDDNRDWALDFNRPCTNVWSYVCDHYADLQERYGFDFMRGDMSHVQMRPEGVPSQPDAWYDLHGAVKSRIRENAPWFGYFAESFLTQPGEMAYGDECAHLEASLADVTLGNLQSEPLGTAHFMREFARYRAILSTRRFAPSFTILTADKDDPRFDAYYVWGNELRYFLALFLTDMPSYMALGFERREPHIVPANNEQYSKLYVFHQESGPQATSGPWQWGRNENLFGNLVRQKKLAETLLPEIGGMEVEWLVAPDPEGQRQHLLWTQKGRRRYYFVANLSETDPVAAWRHFLPAHSQLIFSTQSYGLTDTVLFAGEGRVYRV